MKRFTALVLVAFVLAGCGNSSGSESGESAPADTGPEPVVDLAEVTISDPGGSVAGVAASELSELLQDPDLAGGTVELGECPLLTEEQLRADLSFEPEGVASATLEPYGVVKEDEPSLLCGVDPGIQLWISRDSDPISVAMRALNEPDLHWSEPTPMLGGEASMYCRDDNGVEECGVVAALDSMMIVGRLFIRGVERQEVADWFSEVVLAAAVLG